MAITDKDDLAQYIEEECYQPWLKDKEPLTEKFNRNREAFLSIPDNLWKPDHDPDDKWRSTAFIGKPHQKIMAFYSIIIDLATKGGKIPFSLALDDKFREQVEALPPQFREVIFPQSERQMELMKGNISSHFEHGKAVDSLRKCILSAAVYGGAYSRRHRDRLTIDSGWRPMQVPGISDTRMINPDVMSWEKYIEEAMIYQFLYVPVWDMFRDLTTNDLLKCDGLIHRKVTTTYYLRTLINNPFYRSVVIKEILKDGIKEDPEDKQSLSPVLRDIGSRKNRVTIKEFSGRVPRVIADDFEKSLKSSVEDYTVLTTCDVESDGDEVEIRAAVCDGRTVGFARTEICDRPFYYIACEDVLDELKPRGVADNIEQAVYAFNDTFRNTQDNKKLAANVQGVVKEEYLEDGKLPKNKPGGLIPVAASCDDARKAYQPVVVPDTGAVLIELLALLDRYIDEDSMIPKISQGVQINNDSTAYEIDQLVAAAGKYAGQFVKNIDAGMIKPWAQSIYDSLMREEGTRGKGNYKIIATGFESYQNRLTLVNTIQRYLSLVLQVPELKEDVRFREVHEKLALVMDVDVDTFMLSPEEKAQKLKDDAQAAANSLESLRTQAEILKLNSEVKKNNAQAEDYQEQAAATKAEAIARAQRILSGQEAVA